MSALFDQDTEDEYVDLPPERGRFPKVVLILAIVAALVLVLGVGGRGLYQRQVDPPGDPGEAVAIEVPKGTSITGAADLLADNGVIANAMVFRLWVRNRDVEVQAGLHRFRKKSSYDDVLAVFAKGPAPARVTRVTIPEGLTLRQLVTRLASVSSFPAAEIEAALGDAAIRSRFQPADQPSLEGLLFPSTYELGTKDDARSLVGRMAAQLDIVATQAGIEAGVQASGLPSLTAYEVLIVASLIQAESGNPEESPKIARVIYNRLAQGTPLGIDATSRWLAQQTGQPIDYEAESPYNTRRQVGLPPTPIAAPGEPAITAALRPAEGPWIYYVLEAEGRHFFTASEAEFLTKKNECEQKELGCG